MDRYQQDVVDGARDGSQHLVNGTGDVLPVPFSHKSNSVGVHWLRISFSKQHLADVSQLCSYIWGDFELDGFGLWSYDSRHYWSSGVSLNYDTDDERSNRVHCGQMTLDCPGSALDEMTAPDMQLLIESAAVFEGKCSRIDVFFDDYARLVAPNELHEVIKHHDYSGLRHATIREGWSAGQRIRDEVAFGERGARGNGKYVRFYDKKLESDGDQDCCRWEVEFTHRRAAAVFQRLVQANGDLDAFATLCGSLVAGCITFVHRTGDPNIKRLELYDFWQRIKLILGQGLPIRIKREKDTITGKTKWIERNVSPSLACMRRLFVSDRVFLRWLFDVCDDGEGRMNRFTEALVNEHAASLYYRHGVMSPAEEFSYGLS